MGEIRCEAHDLKMECFGGNAQAIRNASSKKEMYDFWFLYNQTRTKIKEMRAITLVDVC